MTCSIYCHSGRQPCPSPRNCGEGCHFTNATLQTPRDKAVEAFLATDSNPGYDFTLLDAPGNFWDRCSWWQKVLVVCVAVILCGLVGGMAASHLVGPK